MMIGAVILASIIGLTGFGISLGMGGSLLTSIAIYSVTGTVTLAAAVLWSIAAIWATGEDRKARPEWSLAPNYES